MWDASICFLCVMEDRPRRSIRPQLQKGTRRAWSSTTSHAAVPRRLSGVLSTTPPVRLSQPSEATPQSPSAPEQGTYTATSLPRAKAQLPGVIPTVVFDKVAGTAYADLEKPIACLTDKGGNARCFHPPTASRMARSASQHPGQPGIGVLGPNLTRPGWVNLPITGPASVAPLNTILSYSKCWTQSRAKPSPRIIPDHGYKDATSSMGPPGFIWTRTRSSN